MMLGRIFGRGKDDPDQAVCAECGRTLLAGEWTQKIVGGNGEEKLMCSLCMQGRPASDDEEVVAGAAPANAGRMRESRSDARESRSDSDTFWKALKDKDGEIARLEGLLARAEAEKLELAGQLARLRAPAGAEAASAEAVETPGEAPEEPAAERPTGDSSEPGERTWGETPAEFAAEIAALQDDTGSVEEAPAEPLPEETPPAVSDDTQPIAEGLPGEPAGAVPATQAADGPASAVENGAAETTLTPEPVDIPGAPALDAAAEAATLTLLQRGVDLLNVSRVPRKIAETNEQLGLPQVHVGCDGQTVVITFMWSMGWYRFNVGSEGEEVRLHDRGYEELTGLLPNAGVRADGTVQLASAPISRAAAARPQPSATPETPAPATAAPESPRVAAQKPPEILSKSLLGQRSDDEAASWEGTQARDFEWDH
jgi:hypothetical protein